MNSSAPTTYTRICTITTEKVRGAGAPQGYNKREGDWALVKIVMGYVFLAKAAFVCKIDGWIQREGYRNLGSNRLTVKIEHAANARYRSKSQLHSDWPFRIQLRSIRWMCGRFSDLGQPLVWTFSFYMHDIGPWNICTNNLTKFPYTRYRQVSTINRNERVFYYQMNVDCF